MKKINCIYMTIIFFVTITLVAEETEEVIAVASYIESSELDASPVDIISAEEFKNLRVSTVAELSKYLSIASGSHFQTNALDGIDQGMATITLRGLGRSSTLVLVNKKRQTHSGTPSDEGEGYIDINIIPEIALERIEILKDGATSLYGSDAIAGVINFQTYQQFDGTRFLLGSQKTSNYDQRDNTLGVLFGGKFWEGNYVLALSSLNKSPLNAASIPKFAELGLSGLGNSFKITQADSVATGTYAGSYSKNQTIPDPNCVKNGGVIAGPRCKFLYGERFNIVNDEDHLKGYFHFVKSIFDIDYSMTLMTASIDVNDNPQSPSYPALSYLSKEIFPGQGGSPFNVPVIWYGRPLGSAFPSPNSPKAITQYHFSNTLNFNMAKDLNFELSLTASEHENKHQRPDTIESRFEDLILGRGGPDGNERWNIFLPLENSVTLIDYIKGSETSLKVGSLLSLDGILTGNKNGINFAFGFQFNEEDLEINYSETSRAEFDQDGKLTKAADLLFLGGGKNVDTSRNKQAIFFETNKNFENVLDLILSGRYERLDNNSSFDPRISFKYLASENFFLRGSFGTSFTAPSMAQMFSSEIQLGSVRDINDSPFVRLALLGNQYLKPATSENINVGFQWNVTNELDLIIDYWKIDYKNRIEVESPQVLLNTDPFAPSVTRNQFGELIAVSTSYFNEEKTEVSGIDAEINFLKIVEIGELNYSIKATQLSKFLTPENQGGDNFNMVNRVGNFNFDANTHSLPKLRLNSFFSWTINDLRIGINSRYVDGYSNVRQIPASAVSLGYTNYVKSFLVHDFSITKSLQLSFGEIKLGMGIINAFDKKAPLLYDAPDFSFDTRVHDPRGRLINLTLEFNL
ncbi:MAG: TonB-dependent receptor [SAR86 cluster bacterium]|uniref:TonB-dependent receptor n=1 Tax=SAR86 cluster bacterium TaxID=2030880 RepID=A0A838XVS4_9GAMM|nr:TonB-dependent receptor [SAR86 cluster bacterium]